MRLFYQKRAQEELTLPPAFLIAIGLGVVLLAILYAVFRIGSNEAYDRQLAVNNIGIDLQAIQSFGRDINADRKITDGGPYTLVFESGKVYTRERGVPTSTFLFTQVPGLIFKGGEFQPATGQKTIGPMILFKRGSTFGAALTSNSQSPYLLECDTPAGAPLASLAIDPGKGYDGTAGDEGYTIASTATKESKYTMRLARSFSIAATGLPVNPTRALDADSIAGIDARKNTKGDALISFYVGTRADDEEVVKAYYNPKNKNSRRLACEILNGITKEFHIPVRPIPVDVSKLSPDDAKQVLTGRPAVLLELGNARKAANSILKDTGNLANAIYNGVKAYGVV
jgi:hypothetical protein